MLESGPDDKPFGRIATLADPFGQLRNVGRAFLTVQTFTKVSGARGGARVGFSVKRAA